MHECAEDNGKQDGVNQGIHETVVEFDKAPHRIDHKYDGRGDQDRHERIHGISLPVSRLKTSTYMLSLLFPAGLRDAFHSSPRVCLWRAQPAHTCTLRLSCCRNRTC